MNTINRTDEDALPAQLRAAGIDEGKLASASKTAAGLREAVTGIEDDTTVARAVQAFQGFFEAAARPESR